MIHLLHVLIGQWHHGHVGWRLALRYLRREYPGMPRSWYVRYLHYMISHHIGPRFW
jgi:hypothetical protein